MLSYITGSISIILLFLIPAAVEGGFYFTAAAMMAGVFLFFKISDRLDKEGK